MRAVALAALAALCMVGSAAAFTPRQTPEARDFERMLHDLDAKEKALEVELERIGPELEVVKKRLVARGRAYYRLVRAGLLPVGGGFDALVDHAAAVERLRAALGRDVELEQQLLARSRVAAAELKKVRAERAPLTIQREAMERARSVMRQADERQAAFDRAFGSGGYSPPHTAIYGADGPVPAGPVAPFSEMRGRLSFPLTGRAEVLMPTAPSTEPEGLFLVASGDTAVRAVYPGRVAFVGDTQRGSTVVIDHGASYFSVYGQLNHIEVKVDEQIHERGRLGWVLRFGDKSPTLYFEIRRGKKLLDPAPWLGL